MKKYQTELNLTFHRAFDVAQDPFKAVEVIKELGFSRILTSGQVCTLVDILNGIGSF